MAQLSNADLAFLASPWDRKLLLLFRKFRHFAAQALGAFREITVDDAPKVALADVACEGVIINNTSGKSVGVTRGGAGVVVVIPNNAGQQFDVESNANELSLHNATDATSITVQYQCVEEAI